MYRGGLEGCKCCRNYCIHGFYWNRYKPKVIRSENQWGRNAPRTPLVVEIDSENVKDIDKLDIEIPVMTPEYIVNRTS